MKTFKIITIKKTYETTDEENVISFLSNKMRASTLRLRDIRVVLQTKYIVAIEFMNKDS